MDHPYELILVQRKKVYMLVLINYFSSINKLNEVILLTKLWSWHLSVFLSLEFSPQFSNPKEMRERKTDNPRQDRKTRPNFVEEIRS